MKRIIDWIAARHAAWIVVIVAVAILAFIALCRFASGEDCLARECFKEVPDAWMTDFDERYANAIITDKDWLHDPKKLAQIYASGEYGSMCYVKCSTRSLSSSDRQAIFIISRTAGADSISAVRYRIEVSLQPNGIWRIDWVGQQQKCGRGATISGWTTSLCV